MPRRRWTSRWTATPGSRSPSTCRTTPMFSECDEGYFASWGVTSEPRTPCALPPGPGPDRQAVDPGRRRRRSRSSIPRTTPAPRSSIIEELRAIVESRHVRVDLIAGGPTGPPARSSAPSEDRASTMPRVDHLAAAAARNDRRRRSSWSPVVHGLRSRACSTSPSAIAVVDERASRRRSATAPARPSAPTAPGAGSLVIVGRIVTMDEPPIAEALLIEDGTVTAVGTRDEVLALAGDEVPVMDIGAERRLPRVHRRPRPLDRGPRVLRDRIAGGGHGRGPHPRLDLDQRAVGQPGAPRRARRAWPPTTPCRSASTPTSP